MRRVFLDNGPAMPGTSGWSATGFSLAAALRVTTTAFGPEAAMVAAAALCLATTEAFVPAYLSK